MTTRQWKRLKAWIRGSPYTRTGVFIVTVILTGILINQLSDEIKDPNEKMNWLNIPHTKSFFGLSGVTAAVFVSYVILKDPAPQSSQKYIKRFYEATYLKIEERAINCITRGDLEEFEDLEAVIRKMDSNLDKEESE